jgi:hypothetical protein
MSTTSPVDLFNATASTTANVVNGAWPLVMGLAAVLLVLWVCYGIVGAFTGAVRHSTRR